MYRQVRANKFGAKKTEYKGVQYHSKLEAKYAQDFDLMLKAGELLDVDRQFKVELRANGMLICNYYVDFRLHLKDGSFELVEIKGFETDIYRFKRRLLEALWLPEHLDHTYVVYKQ